MFSDNKTLNSTLCEKSSPQSDKWEYLANSIYKIGEKFSNMAVTDSLLNIVSMKIGMFLDEEKNNGTIYRYSCYPNIDERRIDVWIRESASYVYNKITMQLSWNG